jgi:hypothetical protein
MVVCFCSLWGGPAMRQRLLSSVLVLLVAGLSCAAQTARDRFKSRRRLTKNLDFQSLSLKKGQTARASVCRDPIFVIGTGKGLSLIRSLGNSGYGHRLSHG